MQEMIKDILGDEGFIPVLEGDTLCLYEEVIGQSSDSGITIIESSIEKIANWDGIKPVSHIRWSKVTFDLDIKHKEWITALANQRLDAERNANKLSEDFKYGVKDFLDAKNKFYLRGGK
jgi:hypothetical protein